MIPHNTRRALQAANATAVSASTLFLPLSATRRVRSITFAFSLMALMGLCALVLPSISMAGTGGTEFNPAYTTITAWLQGDLGRLIAAALLVVGLVMGVVRQSIMAAVPAIACGLVATVAPTIIGAVVTAVI